MKYSGFVRHPQAGCIQFDNGNLNIRVMKEDLVHFQKDPVFFLSELLSDLNCEFVGETFCLSNFDTGHLIYNSFMDCCYIFPWRDLETLCSGKTVKLYAHRVTDDEREWIEKEN